MKKRIVAGALALGISAAVFALPAEAGCQDTGSCQHFKAKTKVKAGARKAKAAPAASRSRSHKATPAAARKRSAKRAKPAVSRALSRRSSRARSGLMVPAAGGGHVVTLIRTMAPSYGVPTWFALRIAQVESNYNPSARGRAGELGVFQLKCATARGIGYRGTCSGLLDAGTGVRYGLIHLSLAMRASGGDLKLAASKHNAGLAHRRLVPNYVAKVF